ncbi:hypothetical protein SAMN05428949_2001 [Chitinophaga sp. YR627]|nr:hypothetical protein SAMN05428949_2001 [Chitinophaga sp. YR627]
MNLGADYTTENRLAFVIDATEIYSNNMASGKCTMADGII